MTLVLDTSALLKRYVEEAGSDEVRRIMDQEATWCASQLVVAETRIALCRLIEDPDELAGTTEHFAADVETMVLVPVDIACLDMAADIGCGVGQLRTLDAVHLAAAQRLPGKVRFLTFDMRQRQAAERLGYDTGLGQ